MNHADAPPGGCPVNSHTEWDPLEEVIIGSVDGAMFPAWDRINDRTVPPGMWQEMAARYGGPGAPYPEAVIDAARAELEGFVDVLEGEGVVVRRLDARDHARPFGTPDWQVSSGFCAANPRDPFMIVGDEIIEAPMADRSRYFESGAYRALFKDYFRAGARWSAAPRPQLLDALYAEPGSEHRFAITEFEPVFDAADFVRCGRDIFAQESNVTNAMGIAWLQRHLGEGYRVHTLRNRSAEAIHIDTTFMPLAPGKVLVNPEYLDFDALPPVLDGWDLLVAPEPPPLTDPMCGVSEWAGINVLMLDERRVVVEARQAPLIKALTGWGFDPIPLPFEHYYPLLGSFHCATLDIRRRGQLRSYV